MGRKSNYLQYTMKKNVNNCIVSFIMSFDLKHIKIILEFNT
jgi:hypothetical protein